VFPARPFDALTRANWPCGPGVDVAVGSVSLAVIGGSSVGVGGTGAALAGPGAERHTADSRRALG
jgi:hypothetical protein